MKDFVGDGIIDTEGYVNVNCLSQAIANGLEDIIETIDELNGVVVLFCPFNIFEAPCIVFIVKRILFRVESSSNKNINVMKFLNRKTNAQFCLEQALQKQLQPHGGMN